MFHLAYLSSTSGCYQHTVKCENSLSDSGDACIENDTGEK